MDEVLLVRVLTVLVRAHDALGEECFEQAARDAIGAVARRTLIEAERRARGAEIIPFPGRPASTDSRDDA